MKPSHEEQIAQKSEAELAHEAKLQELSKQTGLTIETLRMIKKVEDKVTEKKQETKKVIDTQMDKQRYQTLTTLASQIRYAF